MIEKIICGGFETNTYIISNKGKCVIVDPGLDFLEYSLIKNFFFFFLLFPFFTKFEEFWKKCLKNYIFHLYIFFKRYVKNYFREIICKIEKYFIYFLFSK